MTSDMTPENTETPANDVPASSAGAPGDDVYDFKDRWVICSDCGQPFVFSASEQDFFFEKDLSEPKRCKLRRDERKRAQGTKLPPVTNCPMAVKF